MSGELRVCRCEACGGLYPIARVVTERDRGRGAAVEEQTLVQPIPVMVLLPVMRVQAAPVLRAVDGSPLTAVRPGEQPAMGVLGDSVCRSAMAFVPHQYICGGSRKAPLRAPLMAHLSEPGAAPPVWWRRVVTSATALLRPKGLTRA